MTIDELIDGCGSRAGPAARGGTSFRSRKNRARFARRCCRLRSRNRRGPADDYRQFLLRSNGGSLGDKYEEVEAYVVIGSVGGFREGYSLRSARSCYQGSPLRIPRALPWIMDDPGCNAICLGLTGEHRGNVYFWDHDEEPYPGDWDGRVETAGNIQLLANSFTKFVASLRRREDK